MSTAIGDASNISVLIEFLFVCCMKTFRHGGGIYSLIGVVQQRTHARVQQRLSYPPVIKERRLPHQRTKLESKHEMQHPVSPYIGH